MKNLLAILIHSKKIDVSALASLGSIILLLCFSNQHACFAQCKLTLAKEQRSKAQASSSNSQFNPLQGSMEQPKTSTAYEALTTRNINEDKLSTKQTGNFKLAGKLTTKDQNTPIKGAKICWLPGYEFELTEYLSNNSFLLMEANFLDSVLNLQYIKDEKWKKVTSGLDGSFELEIQTSRATGCLLIWGPGFQAQLCSIDLSSATNGAQKLSELRFQLSPCASVSGKVLDNNGKPAAGMLVRAFVPVSLNPFSSRNSESSKWITTVEADGSYHLTGLPLKSFRIGPIRGKSVYALCPPSNRKHINFKTKAVHKNIDFVVEKGGTVNIRVHKTDGNPLPDVRCYIKYVSHPAGFVKEHLNLEQDVPTLRARTNSKGQLSFPGLALNHGYSVSIFEDGYAFFESSEIPLKKAKQSSDLEVVLSAGYSVSGRIHHKNGIPACTAMTILIDNKTEIDPYSINYELFGKQKKCQIDGSFKFEHLPPGKYIIIDGEYSILEFANNRFEARYVTQVEIIDKNLEDLKLEVKNPFTKPPK